MSRARIGETAMHAGAKQALATEGRAVLVFAFAREDCAQRLIERVKAASPSASIACVDTIERLLHAAKSQQPDLVIVDERILGGAPPAETIRELAEIAPVVLIAAHERHGEISRLVAAGRVDFVQRAGDWEVPAASAIERRLRSGGVRARGARLRADNSDDDMGEIFRHEINNPLTGILGNAELLLSHSESFPAAETQRIRTVVELAVRLRETVRRFSDRWGKTRET